jgi:GYF domain 2
MKKYFLHNGKDQHGPYSTDDLKVKGLNANTMVWFEGISTWTEAQFIPELKEFVISTPPPFEKSNSINQTFDKAKKVIDKDYVNEIENKIQTNVGKKIFKYSLIVLAILGLVFIISMLMPSQEHKEKNNAPAFLSLQKARLRHINPNGIFGDGNKPLYWEIEGQITNSAKSVTYKDIKIEIEFFTATNTSLEKTIITLYKVFPPNNLQDKYEKDTFFEIKLDIEAPKDTYSENTKMKLIDADVYEEQKSDSGNK